LSVYLLLSGCEWEAIWDFQRAYFRHQASPSLLDSDLHGLTGLFMARSLPANGRGSFPPLIARANGKAPHRQLHLVLVPFVKPHTDRIAVLLHKHEPQRTR
jgi:hypothetical protein